MSKCISIVSLLGTKSEANPKGLLKEKDMQVFTKIQQRICHELKESMEIAIEMHNQELE